jgi:hypothetical protein
MRAGIGLSDPLDHVPTVDEGADDPEAVIDTARVEHAVLFASVGGLLDPPAPLRVARSAQLTASSEPRSHGRIVSSPSAVGA